MICFEIPGNPVGKSRPRVTKFGTHNTEKTINYENLIKVLCPKNKFYEKEYLKVFIKICYKPVQSESNKRKKLMLVGKILPNKKPDVDNVAKIVLDALNGIAYNDDKQVIELQVIKKYEDKSRVEVCIQEIKI